MDGLSQNQLKYILQKQNLQLIKKIGSGSFGTVFLANCTLNDYLPFAIKVISKKQFIKQPSLQKYLTSEVHSMELLKNSHVIRLNRKFEQSGFFFIVMEYCELGNLYTYQFTQPDKIFKLPQALKIFIDVLKGVNAIHKQNVIHRDIKCENVLLKKKSKNQGFICKIGDFGFAKSVEEATKSHCGTPNFMAPQILQQKSYDKQVDIWSLGVILYYMLFADYPFKGLNLLYDIQVRCKQKYNLMQELMHSPSSKKNKSIGKVQYQLLANLFARIFVVDPSKRIQLKQLWKHQIFKDFKEIIQNQDNSTESSQSFEQLTSFSIKKIEFIQETFDQISKLKILTVNTQKIIQFYLNRVQASMLRNLYKSIGKKQEVKGLKKQITIRHDVIMNHLTKLKKQINLQKYQTPKIKQLVLSSSQMFESFKDEYRQIIGWLFSQIHNKLGNSKIKQKLKLKVLCCHTINRVFQNGLSQYFLHYQKWLKQKKMNSFSFQSFHQWTQNQTSENILKTISLINAKFYSKK